MICTLTDHMNTFNIETIHGNATVVAVSNKSEGEEEMKKAGVLLFMEHY